MFSIILVVLLGIVIFIYSGKTASKENGIDYNFPLTINGVKMNVALADNPAKRTEGLSSSKALGLTEGMLFIFEEDNIPSFWMKDMNYALDIIWIDATKTVVGVEENVLPETYPTGIFSPLTPIRYVLEAPAGFAKAHNIIAGSKVSF